MTVKVSFGDPGGSSRSIDEVIEQLKGCEKRFKRLIEKRIARQHVEDVWQESLLRMVQRLRAGEVIHNVNAYMATICQNTTTDMLRQLARQAQALAGEDIDANEQLHLVVNFDHGVGFEKIQKVLRAELTPHQHKIYILKHYYGLDSRSIAELVGAAGAGAVRQSIRAANRKLRTPAVLQQLGVSDA
ncbi:RNA polymerase sigma factor [Streptomyces griseorubiginosus]|uniref:RNA polymerase sigma factor n=1 Tax=Streptomyces griseorubiginosus TaxID=67304 RepID=UPI003640281D